MDENERNLKNELREAHFRIDELESRLDCVLKEKLAKEKQINDQNKVIQQLRDKNYKSIEINEYQSLKEKFEKNLLALSESENKIEFLSKKLNTESEEIELLHNKNDSQLNQINKLKKCLKEYKSVVRKQNLIIEEIKDMRESRDYYKKEFEKSLIENSELSQLLDAYREENLRQNEANISVEDLNQSISKFWDSLNANTSGESMDCVIDIKLSDVEKALEEKKRLNEELQNRLKVMNEEIKQLIEIQNKFEKKVDDMKINCNEVKIKISSNENLSNINESSKSIKEKESFDKMFDFLQDRFLSYIPLSGYFVPISKRVIFTFTPKFLLRLL